MTCPTTAVFNGLPDAETKIPLGKHIRFFGDGFQKSKQVAGRRYWRIPVMDGEFLVEDVLGVEQGRRRRQHHPASRSIRRPAWPPSAGRPRRSGSCPA